MNYLPCEKLRNFLHSTTLSTQEFHTLLARFSYRNFTCSVARRAILDSRLLGFLTTKMAKNPWTPACTSHLQSTEEKQNGFPFGSCAYFQEIKFCGERPGHERQNHAKTDRVVNPFID